MKMQPIATADTGIAAPDSAGGAPTTTGSGSAVSTHGIMSPLEALGGTVTATQRGAGGGEAATWSRAASQAGSWLTASAVFGALEPAQSYSPVSAAELPALPSAPSGGSAFSAPGGGASTALYALLLAFAALALLRFDRLRLQPVQWRCAAFVALLERPG